jgi:nucleosome binding factor SPN SPT16 subunit
VGGPLLGNEAVDLTRLYRYALHLVDTIKVGSAKSITLTEACKSTKDFLFFLTPESDEEMVTEEKPTKRKPPVQPKANGSPAKKTAGNKVLRTNRRAAQDEVHQTAAAKLAEHQREIHERLQTEGLAKYSEEGEGTGGKEGKGWKKFQSYKGEGALPTEAERLRVRRLTLDPRCFLLISIIDLRRPKSPHSHSPHPWFCGSIPYQYD